MPAETITIKAIFTRGQSLYLKTDVQQLKGILLYVSKNWNGGTIYGVTFGEGHIVEGQGIEFSEEIDLGLKEKNLPPLPKEDDED